MVARFCAVSERSVVKPKGEQSLMWKYFKYILVLEVPLLDGHILGVELLTSSRGSAGGACAAGGCAGASG